jgi:selenocysteine-specific elongation factor
MIIGTAGHVDHGKTELIKALTGFDTDRLKEEKERGISIDIGFAPFYLPGGRLAGVVDVPGHEKFIHNMLAGIGGIDLVLMVIDAAEGVMPQTREHLDILELLGILKGLVVITKIDLVDEEWLEMVVEEVKESFKGTFLEGAPLHLVSSVTKAGIPELKKDVAGMSASLAARDGDAPLRIPVDRVFTIAGFGTVVTGTIISGTVKTGEIVEVVPPGKEFRVRGLQVHGEAVGEASAGQRAAVNLSGLEKREVLRGSVVAAPGYFRPTRFLDTRLKLLSSAHKTLVNLSPVHFYLGTARVVAKLLLLGCDELAPGEEGFVQCRLDRPLVARRGDRFIIRSYSPMVTIGGGVVLDEHPPRHKRFKSGVLEKLEDLHKDDPLPFVMQKLEESRGGTLAELAQLLKMGPALSDLLERARKENKAVLIGDYYVTAGNIDAWGTALLKELARFHSGKPLWPGMHKAQLSGIFPRKITGRAYDSLLDYYKQKGLIEIKGDIISRKDFVPRPTAMQEQKIEEILRFFIQGGITPPSLKDLWSSLGLKKEEGESYLEYLINKGSIVRVSEEIFLHREPYAKCLDILKEHFRTNRSISLAQYRDLLGSSRKYAQALLEHFDSCKFTRRLGDERVPWKLPG